jgi:WD40 repeat protein
MATCGLDCTVKLWDVRKLKSKSPTKSSSNAVATFHSPKSINSAFFSPSGKYLLATTMSDKLEIISDAHKTSGRIIQSPTHSICHDNRTGRWLTTFNAKWHPGNREDLFVVGSMQQPRTIEVFNADKGKIVKAIRGEALTSVMSRCCFHPREDKLIVLGGNSSGRLAVAR